MARGPVISRISPEARERAAAARSRRVPTPRSRRVPTPQRRSGTRGLVDSTARRYARGSVLRRGRSGISDVIRDPGPPPGYNPTRRPYYQRGGARQRYRSQ